MHRYALPFPVAPGKTDEDAGSIAAYFRANLEGYRESRRRLGTTLERVYLQRTPMGSMVVTGGASEQHRPGSIRASGARGVPPEPSRE